MEKTIRDCEDDMAEIQQQETQSRITLRVFGMLDIPNYKDEKRLCD